MLRRESTRRRAANVAAAKPPVTGRGFYIPVILATAGIHPFAILLFARKRKRRFIAENGKPLRRQSRRKFPPPLAALISAAFCGATHSRIFPSCFARWFALRANGKNAAIIACAIMTAPKARLDSRLRENDGDIKSPSSQMALCRHQHSPPCGELIPACGNDNWGRGNDGDMCGIAANAIFGNCGDCGIKPGGMELS